MSRNDRRRPDGSVPGNGPDRIEALIRLAGPRPEVPPECAHRVRAAVHAEWRRTTRRRAGRARIRPWVGLAVAASLVVALGTWVFRPLETDRQSVAATLERLRGEVHLVVGTPDGDDIGRRAEITDELSAGTRIEIGSGGGAALRLASGHSVRLAALSTVTLGPLGEISVSRGEVYIDSGRTETPSDPSLSVATPFGVVTEMGTQYIVGLLGDAVRVAVREGSVRIAGEGESGLRDHMVVAGWETRFDGSGVTSTTRIPIHGASWAWVLELAPEFDLDGLTLDAFLTWAEREGGLRIEFDEPDEEQAKRAIRLSGSLSGLSLEESIAAVLPTCGLSYRMDDGLLLIVRE